MSKLRGPCRTVEVFIVDAHGAAAQALGSHRPTAESTHVLCRHMGESTAAFQKRVQDRIERIRSCRRIRSLWYVVGSESLAASADAGAAEGGRARTLPLLDTLMPMLETGASLTVIGPGTHQGAVFAWLDSLIPQHRCRVTISAQLYPHPSVAATQPRRAPPRSSPMASAPALRALSREPELALAESA